MPIFNSKTKLSKTFPNIARCSHLGNSLNNHVFSHYKAINKTYTKRNSVYELINSNAEFINSIYRCINSTYEFIN